jgi:hypothetical protein
MLHFGGTMAQHIDSVYYIKVISMEDQRPLSSTWITANGIRKGQTSYEGFVKLERKELYSHTGKTSVTVFMLAEAVGFKTLRFKIDTLRLNDTVQLALEKRPIVLEEVLMVNYKIPIIERKHGRKKKVETRDSAISYTEKELKDYVLIVRNKWPLVDSLRNHTAGGYTEWHNYLRDHLSYPDKAWRWNIEERVYVSFELDQQGYLQNIQLRRDCNPLFAIAVMEQLSIMPRLIINKEFDPPP